MKKSLTSPGGSYVWMSIVFLLYLSIIPSLVSLVTPCMHAKIGSSYSYQTCNTVFVLDRFVMLALGGAVVTLVTSFFFDKKRSYRSLIVVVCIVASATISAYYLYAPRAQRSIKKAPILLESLR